MRALRIMVIEDYDALRDAICKILIEDGHQVIGLPMAEDVDDEPTGFVSDLYIVDINLPGEDGISLAARIRRSQPNVGIVIVSARTGLTDRVHSYTSGANIYLTKPLELNELRAVISGFAQRLSATDQEPDQSMRLYPMKMELAGPSGSSRLTQTETALLAAFSRAPQLSLEHWQVASHLSNLENLTKDNLEVKLGRLRKKLILCGAEPPAILSMRGFGYRLLAPTKVLNH